MHVRVIQLDGLNLVGLASLYWQTPTKATQVYHTAVNFNQVSTLTEITMRAEKHLPAQVLCYLC